MSYFLVNVLLALLWASLQQFRLIDFVSGFVLGYGLIWTTREWAGGGGRRYTLRVIQIIRFMFYYLGELIVSTWDVTKAIFRDQSKLRP